MTDKAERRYAIEERAAIIEEGEKCSRFVAQEAAARAHGYESWAEAMRVLGNG